MAADGKLTHMYFDRFDTILSTSVKDERLREGTLIWIDKCATLKNWLHTDVPNETDICYWNQKKGNITPITARATAYKSVM